MQDTTERTRGDSKATSTDDKTRKRRLKRPFKSNKKVMMAETKSAFSMFHYEWA